MKTKLIIGALCWSGSEDRMTACRETWVRDAVTCPVITFMFFTGGAKCVFLKGDILYLPCEDDFEHIIQKTKGFMAYALKNYDFDYLFHCDDDTYVAIDRLLSVLSSNRHYVGGDVGNYASGGGGIFLPTEQ